MAGERKLRILSGFLVAAGLGSMLLAGAVFAADPPPQNEPAEPKSDKPAATEKASKGPIKVDTELEGPVEPLKPEQPRTPEEQARLDALAWYMSGQIKEARNEISEAFSDYEQAAKLDPKAIQVYRALVPLAFSLNKTDKAMEYALKAIQIDPNDVQLLRRLGVHLASQRKLDEAARYLEQAAQSASIKKDSVAYVSLHRDLAILFSELGQPEKVAQAYEVVFDALLHPDAYNLDFNTRAQLKADPVTQFERIGEAFFAADRPQLAVQAFEKALEARKGKPGTLSFNLARAYVKVQRYDDALGQLQTYFDAQLQTQGREPYQLLADILKQNGKSDELLGRLEAIAKNDPRNSTLQYFLADQYVAADRLKEAEEVYNAVLKDTADPEGYVGLATIYQRQNRAAELLDALGRALKGKKGLDRLEELMDSVGGDEKLVDELIAAGREQSTGDEPKLNFYSSYVLAKLASQAKRTDAVVEFYRFAHKARRNQGALIFLEMGRYLYLEKLYARAAEVFQEAAADPALEAGKPDFLLWLSRSKEMAGDTPGALAAVQEALKLNNHPELHFHEAWIYTHSKQWDEAIKHYEALMARFPQEKEFVRRCLFSLSNVHVLKGDLATGEKILEDYYAKEPEDPSVNNDLGYLYADQGKNLEQAEKMIRKAIASEPDNPAYLDSMGWVLFKKGKFEEAVEYLEKAVKTPSGSDATIWEHLGDCYEKLNKMDKAAEAWQKGLKDAQADTPPDEKVVDRLQDKLKKK